MVDEREVRTLIDSASEGDDDALNELMQCAYGELRSAAHRLMRKERHDHTLQTTALIHEAYLRVLQRDNYEWKDAAHFLRSIGQSMRFILVSHARAKNRQKRKASGVRIDLGELSGDSNDFSLVDFEALDSALNELEQFDETQTTIVELRFFAGLSVDETAMALDISPSRVKREWQYARAWLQVRMNGD